MAWWLRRDQWPHLELGPFTDRADADQLAAHFAALPANDYASDWTWTVTEGDWTGSHQ